MIRVIAVAGAVVFAAGSVASAAQAPKVLAVCDAVTNVMLCKPMDTLSLPEDATMGDARIEAKRRYGQVPWVCDLNVGRRVVVETCFLPQVGDEVSVKVVLGLQSSHVSPGT
jgi:hypothetical protein